MRRAPRSPASNSLPSPGGRGGPVCVVPPPPNTGQVCVVGAPSSRSRLDRQARSGVRRRTPGFATVAAVLLVSFAAPKLYGDVKIAFVDLQRALNETEDGRRAKGQLKRLFDNRQKALDAEQTKLKVLKETIEKQQKVLTREALQKRMEEYQKAFVELQTTYVDYQRELAEKEAALTKQIFARMEGILRRIGTSEGYTMIFDRGSGVVWGRTDLDLTDRLIQAYNSEAPAGGGGGGAKNKATKSRP